LLLGHVAWAQDKSAALDAKYLRDHAQTRGFMLGRPVKPQFTPDGKSVLFLRSQARNPRLSLYEYDIASSEATAPAGSAKGFPGPPRNTGPK